MFLRKKGTIQEILRNYFCFKGNKLNEEIIAKNKYGREQLSFRNGLIADANNILFIKLKEVYSISNNLFMKVSLVLLLSLLTLSHSASLLTYTFPYDPNSQFNQYYQKPAYSVGSLSKGNTLKITLTVPGQDPTTPASTLGLYYLDGTVSPTTYIQYSFQPQDIVVINGNTYQINVLITQARLIFSNGAIIPSSTFKIVIDNSLATVSLLPLTYFYLQANYYPTKTGISVVNPSSTQVLLKIVDIFRYDVVKVIYVSKDNLVFNFTQFPDDLNQLPLLGVYKLNIPTITTTGFTGNGINNIPIGSIPVITTVNKITTYSYNDLTAGYYLIQNFYDLLSYAATARIAFHTDPYACPYSSDYNDFYLNFQGCTKTATNPNGAPCASFDPVTQTCSLCIAGYELINGTCFANTTCPARQYYTYGFCVNASATCGDFDKFTGNCLSCADPANFYLANGSCLYKTVTCGQKQWQSNYTCFNVSSTCNTFDPYTGSCLTCISKFYQLNSNGTCTLIVVVCPQGQYAKGLECVNIPVECLKFNTEFEKCQSCVKGYFVENGICKRIVCPSRQVPSEYGIFCVDVSSLCDQFDSISGNCLTCKNSGYTVRNGKCLQESSPLAGCQEREDLGFGPCVGADLNCKTFNLQTGNCDQCISNFYLDYTGHCVENAKCGFGQWSINGECLGTPENCLKVDDLGLCVKCVSKNYRLHQGQCVYFKSCSDYQYLNAGGQCVNVSPNCGSWNPSNGQCITCKLANTHPSGGVCCPAGQVYSSGKCVNANDLQNSYQDATGSSCLIRHPSLKFCLKCVKGYDPIYTLPYACTRTK